MIFDANFSMRERPDFSAGFSHQAVVLWSAFFDAGFSSSWAKRGEIARDGETRGQCAFPFIIVLRDFVWSG